MAAPLQDSPQVVPDVASGSASTVSLDKSSLPPSSESQDIGTLRQGPSSLADPIPTPPTLDFTNSPQPTEDPTARTREDLIEALDRLEAGENGQIAAMASYIRWRLKEGDPEFSEQRVGELLKIYDEFKTTGNPQADDIIFALYKRGTGEPGGDHRLDGILAEATQGTFSLSTVTLEDLALEKATPLEAVLVGPGGEALTEADTESRREEGYFTFIGSDLVETQWGTYSLKAIDDYMGRYAKGKPPFDAATLMRALSTYNAHPSLALAQFHIEAHFATVGRAADYNNPGNVGNDDSGNNIGHASMEEGIEAYARYITAYYGDGEEFIALGGRRRDGVGPYATGFAGQQGTHYYVAEVERKMRTIDGEVLVSPA